MSAPREKHAESMRRHRQLKKLNPLNGESRLRLLELQRLRMQRLRTKKRKSSKPVRTPDEKLAAARERQLRYRKRKRLEKSPEFPKLDDDHLLWRNARARFFRDVAQGPTVACVCCDRLWFEKSTRSLKRATVLANGGSEQFVDEVFNGTAAANGRFCVACHNAISKLEIPQLAVCNGFRFPEIPACLRDLNRLEERLISARIPFMQIRETGQTSRMKGSVVNVPIDLDTTVNSLPRNLDDSYYVHVKLKRRLTTDSDYMYELVNPQRVFEAAQYLNGKTLYRDLNIGVSLDWYEKFRDRKFDVGSATENIILAGGGGICLAPGDNETPLPLFDDPWAEEISFPTIYCGEIRQFRSSPTPLQIANSEIRRSDRRAARTDHLFYVYSKYLRERLRNATSFGSGGYSEFLKNVKTSPAHWRNERKRVVAAIRQFGLPTLYVVVSAAYWYELVNCLSQTVDGETISRERFERMRHPEKCRLAKLDPVTCAIYSDHRFRRLWDTWKCKRGPFGPREIEHSYHRMQFARGGLPRAHVLLWLSDVPRITEALVDETAACSADHPFATRRENTFFFPMDRTRILEPLADPERRRKFESLRARLPTMDGDATSFDRFLESQGIASVEEYVLVVRSGIDGPTVFHRRGVADVRVNAYSPKILDLMRSETDVRFVLGERDCRAYLDDVFASRRLRRRKGGGSLQSVANAFAGASRVCAQEAAWCLLELPTSRLSEDDVFVPTYPPELRGGCDLIRRYSKRPESLESVTLAEFGTGYSGDRKRKRTKILRYVGYRDDESPDRYREQLMLYVPWRDEKRDFGKADFKTVYEERTDDIGRVRSKFARFDVRRLEQEGEEAESVGGGGGDVSAAADREHIHREKIDVFEIPARLPDDEYHEQVRKANPRQHHLLKHLMHHAATSEPRRIFVTGPAGCGKSFLIHTLTETLLRVYEDRRRGCDPSSLKVLKMAPTGRAAHVIRGVTLHCGLGLPADGTPPCSYVDEYRHRYRDLRAIVIDEISMVGSRLLTRIDRRLRQIRDDDRPFGGLDVVAFGDLRQLPPVRDRPVYANPIWKLFEFYELTEVMRQRGDEDFVRCLNNMAEGKMDERDVALMRSRQNLRVPESAIGLFHTNDDVDEFNETRLGRMTGEECLVEAGDVVTGKGTPAQRRRLLQRVRDARRGRTANLSTYLTLKVSARYMLVHNANAADGLVNGLVGVLRNIERCENGVAKRIWLEFEDRDVGELTRKRYGALAAARGIDPSYTPVERTTRRVLSENDVGVVTRNQFPVQVAEAMTIHKSQGATYPECFVKLKPNMCRRLLYVGCSRVVSAEGLYLAGNFAAPGGDDDDLDAELRRLRGDPLIPHYQFLDRDDGGVRFMYHGTLPPRVEDVSVDPCFARSHLIFLSTDSDCDLLPGFDRLGPGILVRGSDLVPEESRDDRMAVANFRGGTVRFVVVRGAHSSSVLDALRKDRSVVASVLVGDIGVDPLHSEEGRRFAEVLKTAANLELRTSSGTDAIFSNVEALSAGVYVSTYSCRRPLYGRIDT